MICNGETWSVFVFFLITSGVSLTSTRKGVCEFDQCIPSGLLQLVGATKISIKTGTETSASTDATAELKKLLWNSRTGQCRQWQGTWVVWSLFRLQVISRLQAGRGLRNRWLCIVSCYPQSLYFTLPRYFSPQCPPLFTIIKAFES